MRIRLCALLLVAGIGLSVQSTRGQAVIEGKVQLPSPASESASNQRYASAGEGVRAPSDPPMAVVYLEGASAAGDASGSRRVMQMAQQNINFAPGLLAVQVGTTVEFPNLDDTYHNVFSYSKTKRFDLGRYRKDEKAGTVLFDKPGVVTLHCEVHEKMRGTVLVLDTPYFQKTDLKGHYRLEHLPAGHYVLKAWISEDDVRAQPVDVKAGAPLRVDFPAK